MLVQYENLCYNDLAFKQSEYLMQDEFGVQPLDEVMESCSLKNDDLVEASSEQLTHKQVQKARKGRCITPNIKGKIVRALNAVVDKEKYIEEFTY